MKESKFWKQYGSVLLLLGGILIGSLIGIFSPDQFVIYDRCAFGLYIDYGSRGNHGKP